jgi:hypothetical protein
MHSFIHHIGTSLLNRSINSTERAPGFQYKTDIAIKAESAPILNVIFRSYIREGENCLSLVTNSCFEADNPVVAELPKQIEKEEIRKECAKMLMTAQAEHLKILSHELPGEKISILCVEPATENQFEQLLQTRRINFA